MESGDFIANKEERRGVVTPPYEALSTVVP